MFARRHFLRTVVSWNANLLGFADFLVAADYCKIDSGVLQHLCICLSFISIVSQAFFLSVAFVLSKKRVS